LETPFKGVPRYRQPLFVRKKRTDRIPARGLLEIDMQDPIEVFTNWNRAQSIDLGREKANPHVLKIEVPAPQAQRFAYLRTGAIEK
jgi:hypothetical protein